MYLSIGQIIYCCIIFIYEYHMYKIQSKSPPTHVRVEKTCVSPHISSCEATHVPFERTLVRLRSNDLGAMQYLTIVYIYIKAVVVSTRDTLAELV